MRQEAAVSDLPWSSTGEVDSDYDCLLSCLTVLTKLHGRPVAATSLTAGLPLENNRLTPQLFIKAAERTGLSARIVKRPLSKITTVLLPAVLLLKGSDACVLLSIDKQENRATIIVPETGEGEAEIPCDELEQSYSGYAIFLKPEHQFDDRVPRPAMKASRHWFWGTLGRSWRIYRDVLLASFFVNIFALASPMFIMNVYDRVVPNNAFETLWVLGLGIAIVYCFDLLFRGLRGYFIDLAGKKADLVLSSMIYEKVLGLKMDERPPSVGAFANNLGEFENIRNFITSATISTLIDLPFVLLFILVIAFIGGSIVYVPLVGIPIILLYGLLVQRPLRESVEQVMSTRAQKNATLIESLIGAETIKTSNAEGQLQKKWEQATAHIADYSVRSRVLSASVTHVATFIQQLATVAVVALGVYLAAANELSLGGLIAVVILTSRAMAPMAQVANLTAHIHEARTALKTLNRVMDLPIERQSPNSYIHRAEIKGGVEFENVSFTYPGESQTTLDAISFSVKPGEHVGIIGRTGSGKTTLQKLLLGIYQPASGVIKLDDIDLQQIDPAELRKHIGYVPQDIMLFYGSLRDNITLGMPFMEGEQVFKAAQLAGVSEFSNHHELGLDMPLGERGQALSGGQRQSVVIARALLGEPPVIVMDEPSNSMDNHTEAKLLARLSKYLEGRTLLMVSHRASMLKIVDRLIVLEKGRIIADGPKQTVLDAMKEGHLTVQH